MGVRRFTGVTLLRPWSHDMILTCRISAVRQDPFIGPVIFFGIINFGEPRVFDSN